MKTFFLKHKKLHIWLLADLCLLAAFFLTRGNRAWMNALAGHVTGPLKRAVGRLCYLTDASVMEMLYVLAALLGIGYVVWSVIAVIKARGPGDTGRTARRWEPCVPDWLSMRASACCGALISGRTAFRTGPAFMPSP